jgi:hypothetical protein
MTVSLISPALAFAPDDERPSEGAASRDQAAQLADARCEYAERSLLSFLKDELARTRPPT